MTALPDRNFDDLSAHFKRNIYASPRGRIRLQVLKQDFTDLRLVRPNMRVLDAGGGQGQFSLWLAQQQAEIHLCDISSAMLAEAQANFQQHQQALKTYHLGLAELERHFNQPFDLVLNHAVLEWLAEPLSALPLLAQQVKSGGVLSLMFYNLHGHVWRQLMNGRSHDPLGAKPRLRERGNAPQHPLDPKEVIDCCQALGLTLRHWRGVRCIYDPMHQKIRDRIGEEKILAAELEYGLKDPYRQLARYVHLVFSKD